MLQVHDSAARWRSFFEETCANEISNFAAQWPEKTGFIQSFEDVQAWDPRFAELIPVSYTHLTLPTICSV